jgi:hypothetical protein
MGRGGWMLLMMMMKRFEEPAIGISPVEALTTASHVLRRRPLQYEVEDDWMIGVASKWDAARRD